MMSALSAAARRPAPRLSHFYKGAIYGGVIMPAVKGKYEDMNFAEEEEPIARYQVKDIDMLTADDHAKIAAFKRSMAKSSHDRR